MSSRMEKENECSYDPDDRLSLLPTEILNHITSLLPARDMIATDVLARGWRRIWSPPSHLRFSDRDEFLLRLLPRVENFDRTDLDHLSPEQKGMLTNVFTEQVYQTVRLINRLGLRSMECLVVSVEDGEQLGFHIRSWMTSASCWKLKRLEMRVANCPILAIPPAVFRCKTLKFLSLNFAMMAGTPKRVWLPWHIPPLVEELHLEGFLLASSFECGSSTRHLKVWKLHNCELPQKFSLEFGDLQTFSVSGCYGSQDLFIKSAGMKHLSIQDYSPRKGDEPSAELFVPNLESFEWSGKPLTLGGTSFAPTTCKISFEDHYNFYSEEELLRARTIVLASVRGTDLELGESASFILKEMLDFNVRGLVAPSYGNIQKLLLTVPFHEGDSIATAHVLQCFPNLKKLVIRKCAKFRDLFANRRRDLSIEAVPVYLKLDNLTEVRLPYFTGTEEEIKFLKIVSEVTMLEKIIAGTSHGNTTLMDAKKRERLLAKFPKLELPKLEFPKMVLLE